MQESPPLSAFPSVACPPTVQEAAAFGGAPRPGSGRVTRSLSAIPEGSGRVTRSLSALPSLEGPAGYEEAVQDLLSRESSRDAEVRALRQEVGDLRQLLRALVRKPGSEQEEEEEEDRSECMASPRDIVSRGINLSPGNLVADKALLPRSPTGLPRLPTGGGRGAFSRSGTSPTLPEQESSPRWSVNSCESFHDNMQYEDPGPPSTMYAYCVFVISTSDCFWSLWQTWYLILMVGCQVVLVFTYSMSEGLKGVNKHMKTFYDESMEELACFYAPMVYHRRPVAFIASVFCSMVIVMCYLRLLDRGTINTIHPEPRSTEAKLLVDFAWFVQAIWLPTMFCGSTAMLLWDSGTPQSVVMNSVGLAYLLEADEYMYSAFVPDFYKQRYVDSASLVHKHIWAPQAAKAESSLFFVAMFQCTVTIAYLHCLNYFGAEGHTYLLGLWCSSLIFMVFYTVRANQILILQPSEDADDDIYVYTHPTSASWKYAFVGIFLYVFLALLTAPKTLLMWMAADWSTYGCASEWLRDMETPGLQV